VVEHRRAVDGGTAAPPSPPHDTAKETHS
jgi:hypothetical protein